VRQFGGDFRAGAPDDSRNPTQRVIIFVLLACCLFDVGLGIWFIVRGNKLMQQGSESNG